MVKKSIEFDVRIKGFDLYYELIVKQNINISK